MKMYQHPPTTLYRAPKSHIDIRILEIGRYSGPYGTSKVSGFQTLSLGVVRPTWRLGELSKQASKCGLRGLSAGIIRVAVQVMVLFWVP